jgi:hypothetical protein
VALRIDDVENETDLERFLTDALTPHLPVPGLAVVVLGYLSPLLPPVTWDELVEGFWTDNRYCSEEIYDWFWSLPCFTRSPIPFWTGAFERAAYYWLQEMLVDPSNGPEWEHIISGYCGNDPRWLLWIHGYLPIPPVFSLAPYCDDPANVRLIDEKSDDEENFEPEDFSDQF